MNDENCSDHSAHKERLDRTDVRLKDLEEGYDEIRVLVTKIDTLVSRMDRRDWILISAVIGSLMTAAIALLMR